MKRVLVFSLAYYPHVGGAEIAIRKITDRLSDIEFHMVTLRFGNELKEEKVGKVHVHRVGLGSSYVSKILFVPLASLLAVRLHRQLHFHALWAMMSYMLLPIVLLRLRGIRLPYALTLQEGDTYQHMFSRLRVLPFLPLLSKGFRGATVVQTISHYLAGWARHRGYKGNVEVIPNGCDVWWFAQEIPKDNRQRLWKNQKNHTIPSTATILITTSRLVYKNAVDTVIKSLALLPSSIHFVVLGKGPEYPNLQTLTKKLGLLNRVHFLGEISNSRIVHFLHAADIFIRPSRSEGMGNSFIEAMAAGLPVIATQEGGIADFLFDANRNPDKQTTGWAVDPDAPEQIAQAIQDILANPAKAKTTVENARKLVSEKYDWNLIARDMREKVFFPLFTQTP